MMADLTASEESSDSPTTDIMHLTQSQDLQSVGTAPMLTTTSEMENIVQPHQPQSPLSPMISIHPPSPAASIKRSIELPPIKTKFRAKTTGNTSDQGIEDPTAGALCNIAYFRTSDSGVDWVSKELPVKGVTHTNESLNKMQQLWQDHLKEKSAFDFMDPSFRWIHLPANNKDWAEVQSVLQSAFMILPLTLD